MMKKPLQFVRIIILLCFITSGNSIAQNAVAQRQPASAKSIPKIVVETFRNQYQDIYLRGWYITHLTYWQNDYSSDWYHGWYSQRTVTVYTYLKPNYYEVEFIVNPGELSRAIYNKYGYWYETRTQINGLTRGIHEALKASKYSDWDISTTMEKLESPAWPVEIYRFQVSNGSNVQILRMDADGNLIQAKDLDGIE